MGERLRLVIADDHGLVLEGLRRALEEHPDIEIVGAATSGSEVIPLVARLDPDIVLMDLRMPRMDGLTCLDRLRKQYPKVRVVILSATHDQEHILSALKRGASGFILKTVDPADLAAALRTVNEGTVYHAFGTPPSDPQDLGRAAGLTERETEILRSVAKGMTTQMIGKEFWVSAPTVKFHLRNVYRKLGVQNRTGAARWAYENGLVSRFPDPDAVDAPLIPAR